MEEIKVGIVIIVYNIPSEIFLLQIAAIKKFCDDDFDIIVFDNSDDTDMAENIRYHASHHKISYTKTFSGSKGSSDSHSWAANFAYQKVKDDYNYLFFLDHDAIPVRHFSVVDTLNGGHVAAGIGQEKDKKYFWPGCLFLNISAIDKDVVDFSTNPVFGLDTGGNLYQIIEKYGEDACVFFNEAYHKNQYFNDRHHGYYATINNEMFLHFVAGSNWHNSENHKDRINSLINITKEKTGL